jgi:hypothetical protein
MIIHGHGYYPQLTPIHNRGAAGVEVLGKRGGLFINGFIAYPHYLRTPLTADKMYIFVHLLLGDPID